jgi:hypothetical protein
VAIAIASGDYFDVGESTKMNVGNLGSLSLWVKTTQTGARAIAARADASASFNGITLVMDSVIALGIKNGVGYINAPTSAATVVNGVWRHLAFNWSLLNGGAGTVYIDGVADGTGANSALFGMSGKNFRVGRVFDTFWSPYIGQVAELGWWNDNLSADEITALAKGFRPPRVNIADLVFYVPGIRTNQDLRGATGSVSGTTPADHPPMR